jgi:hypothetical protein
MFEPKTFDLIFESLHFMLQFNIGVLASIRKMVVYLLDFLHLGKKSLTLDLFA